MQWDYHVAWRASMTLRLSRDVDRDTSSLQKILQRLIGRRLLNGCQELRRIEQRIAQRPEFHALRVLLEILRISGHPPGVRSCRAPAIRILWITTSRTIDPIFWKIMDYEERLTYW